MQPYRFRPIYIPKPWGGDKFHKYKKDVPSGKIGERWDLSSYFHGVSVVEEGEDSGQTLTQLIHTYGKSFLGTQVAEECRLLIKLICPQEPLSVQVHPNDNYAQSIGLKQGKSECWYIIEAEENASLIMGTTLTDLKQFQQAVEEGSIERYLNKVHVKKGDFFYVPAGLIHSIGPGVMVVEVQQCNDVTYRVYDYNRGRELHMEQAMTVIDLSLQPQRAQSDTLLHQGDYFTVEKHTIEGECYNVSNPERYHVYTCVEGKGELSSPHITLQVEVGDTILIPAQLGEYRIRGTLKLLKTYEMLSE